MNSEIWMPVPAFPNYSVSSRGRVKRVKAGRGSTAGLILRQRTNRDGYLCVTLQERERRKGYLVNRLVCEAFNGPPPPGDVHAAHSDNDRKNNRLDNLRWATRIENEADKEIHGTRSRGQSHPCAKLTEAEVHCIRADTRPQSRIAKEYGVSQSLICMVRTGKVWAHV